MKKDCAALDMLINESRCLIFEEGCKDLWEFHEEEEEGNALWDDHGREDVSRAWIEKK